MKTLVINNDGHNFEQMYYRAVCMADIDLAEKKYAEFKKNPKQGFWKEAFDQAGLQEPLLISALINMLDMPFGAYAFKRRDEQCIEIVPWLYSDNVDIQKMVAEMFSEDVTAQTLTTYARTLSLTADFLRWMENYQKKR